jgi:micrococcal nuclease
MGVFILVALMNGGALARTASPSSVAWPGLVTYVVDGDTIRVRPAAGGKPVSIRIQGIDAPEICQPGGTLARDVLMRRLLGKRVAVHGQYHDDYGRLLAKVVFNGEDAGKWMVASGMAWSYRSRGSAGPYARAQRRAQTARLGVFALAKGGPPVYPAQFRKQHGSCH